jgi:hypothetical protein
MLDGSAAAHLLRRFHGGNGGMNMNAPSVRFQDVSREVQEAFLELDCALLGLFDAYEENRSSEDVCDRWRRVCVTQRKLREGISAISELATLEVIEAYLAGVRSAIAHVRANVGRKIKVSSRG